MNQTTAKHRIERHRTQAMLIDVQTRLLPHIHQHELLIKKITILIQGLQALDIPIMLNEQYKKGLGNTLPEIFHLLHDQQSYEKFTFSACDQPDSWQHIAQQNRQCVLLFGIETHVCVMQTALDLLDQGMQPIIIADAVGSRHPEDKHFAIQRLTQSGAIITTTEAILFELCRTSKDPVFKTISNLVK